MTGEGRMTDRFTSAMHALVVATLLCATATVMLVTVSHAYAADALTSTSTGTATISAVGTKAS
jgi:hypothetical protein